MATEFYIAATERMSWGRGTREWEAIGHAVVHGGCVSVVQLFLVTCPDGSTESDVYVNEMGSIIAPKGSSVKQICEIKPAVRLAEVFQGYTAMVDALCYPELDEHED